MSNMSIFQKFTFWHFKRNKKDLKAIATSRPRAPKMLPIQYTSLVIWNIWDNKQLSDNESTDLWPSHLSLERNTQSLSSKHVTHTMIHVRSVICALRFMFPVNSYSSSASTVKDIDSHSTATHIHRKTCWRFVHKLIFDHKSTIQMKEPFSVS